MKSGVDDEVRFLALPRLKALLELDKLDADKLI